MPKIIRSAGVNIERAHPIVAPMKVQPKTDVLVPAAPETEKKEDIQKIQASAEFIVEEILARARNDADNMLVNARAETMRVLQDAVHEGREQGMMEVHRQWAALKSAMEEELAKAAEAVNAERRQIIRDLERDVLELAFDIAEKVLAVEMNRSEAWVAAMIKETLRQMENDNAVVLRVSADARTRVTETAERMLAAAGKPLSGLNVITDSALPPGGCIIETERGIVQNGVEEKFAKLKSVLINNA